MDARLCAALSRSILGIRAAFHVGAGLAALRDRSRWIGVRRRSCAGLFCGYQCYYPPAGRPLGGSLERNRRAHQRITLSRRQCISLFDPSDRAFTAASRAPHRFYFQPSRSGWLQHPSADSMWSLSRPRCSHYWPRALEPLCSDMRRG
jgi:hypothetical protein